MNAFSRPIARIGQVVQESAMPRETVAQSALPDNALALAETIQVSGNGCRQLNHEFVGGFRLLEAMSHSMVIQKSRGHR